ncbi:Nramp family divalent metal transporter [Candidatus Latescibacterota bacterium]
MNQNGIFRKFGLFISAIGPGLFMIGYNIGTGSVTTMASAGSRYGMGLFWTLLFSCIFTYVMIISFGRFTLVTGETSLRAFRKHLPFGNAIAIYLIIGMSIGALAGLAGIIGIVSELISEWTKLLFGGNGVSMLSVALVILIGCYYLLWRGRYSGFEKLLSSLVIIMGICFIFSMFMVIPAPKEILFGMLPKIPDEPNAFLIIAAMTGTTCGAMLFVMRSIIVSEKGWTIDDLKKEKRDALVSVTIMLVLSGVIMACAAGTLYVMGIPVERTIDMVKTLEPIAGRFAMTIFVIGIIGAGVSSVFPVAIVLPWFISDYSGTDRNPKSKSFRVIAALSLLAGLTVPILGGRPVWVMIGSTAFQATLMPIVTLAMFILINNKKLMGKHTPGFWLNAGIVATTIFGFTTGYMGIVGLIKTFTG